MVDHSIIISRFMSAYGRCHMPAHLCHAEYPFRAKLERSKSQLNNCNSFQVQTVAFSAIPQRKSPFLSSTPLEESSCCQQGTAWRSSTYITDLVKLVHEGDMAGLSILCYLYDVLLRPVASRVEGARERVLVPDKVQPGIWEWHQNVAFLSIYCTQGLLHVKV